MKEVASMESRKSDHLRINLENDVQSRLSNGLEKYRLIHEALPEIDLESVDTTLQLFGRKLAAPLLISSMTGGTPQAGQINQRLAEAAAECGVAMGVGSQRAALEDPLQVGTFSIARKAAGNILLLANLGAIQLNNGYGIDECRRAVDMIQADGLILHLNALQEAIQAEGDTNFANLAAKISRICSQVQVPVIVKEVGWGISINTAKILADCGVSAIDVAGAGGTSWSQVEMHRAPDEFSRELAASFADWGISTADSIINVKKSVPGMIIFASGGLKTGVDIAKCLALGASLGGMAGNILKVAAISTETVIKTLRLIARQLKVTMFASGISNLQHFENKIVKVSD